MHAANAAARARARGPVTQWTTSSPWLLNRPPVRLFSRGSPLYGEGQEKAAHASTTETLATRLKQKRSADPQSHSSHDHAAAPSSAGSSRPTASTAKAPGHSPPGPHKVRVPTTGKTGDAAGETRKDRKRAPIEGFKAKRFAMQRLRREQAQAVAEAHGDDWLADEVSRDSPLLACFQAVKFDPARAGARAIVNSHVHLVQHKNPFELGAERYMRTQGHLPIKDQLRLYRARLSLLESLRQPWDKLGRQERQFEIAEYTKIVRAREKRRKGGEGNADVSQSGGAAVQATDAPADDAASTSTVQVQPFPLFTWRPEIKLMPAMLG